MLCGGSPLPSCVAATLIGGPKFVRTAAEFVRTAPDSQDAAAPPAQESHGRSKRKAGSGQPRSLQSRGVNELPAVLKPDQVREVLDVSDAEFAAIQSGHDPIPTFPVGDQARIRRDAFEQWICRRETSGLQTDTPVPGTPGTPEGIRAKPPRRRDFRLSWQPE